MAFPILLSLLLVPAATLCHLATLHWLSRPAAAIPMAPTLRVLLVVLAMFAVHVVEIALYAVAYWWGASVLGIGGLHGLPNEGPLDYFYFSAVTFTTLGIGDVYPRGHLRFLSGIEALNGLLLVAWSGFFIFMAMSRLWEWRTCVPREAGRAAGAWGTRRRRSRRHQPILCGTDGATGVAGDRRQVSQVA